MSAVDPTAMNRPFSGGECFRARQRWLARQHPRIDHDQIGGNTRSGAHRRLRARERFETTRGKSRCAGQRRAEAEEFFSGEFRHNGGNYTIRREDRVSSDLRT